MKTGVAQGLALLAVLAASHEASYSEESDQPFIGWTKEDLDAKWGTDVRSSYRL